MEQSAGSVVLLCALTVLLHSAAVVSAKPIDNVAVQWNLLLSNLICAPNSMAAEPNILVAQMHLAQWHALLALKDTGSCTTEEAVVAYASRKVVSNYFSFQQDFTIDPLLASQLKVLRLSESQQKLAKRLGEAVALSVISKRNPSRDFSLQAVKAALNARQNNPAPGLFRYLNATPASEDSTFLLFHDLAISRPFVVPNPIDFIEENLSHIKPPRVPSHAWDVEYEKVKDIGRANWKGRTSEMNVIASLWACGATNASYCNVDTFWAAAARASLPYYTSLYDTVTFFAKLSVTLHDTWIVWTTLQYGFWYWRPEMAFRAGDAHHPPIPTWTPYVATPHHAEFPSGTVATSGAGATVLQTFFGDKIAPFTVEGATFPTTCPVQGSVGPRQYSSFAAAVRESQLGRMYAGAHYNISITYGAEVGAKVANYIEKHWAHPTPSGVLPDSTYLNVFAHLPEVASEWSPIRLQF